MKRSLLLPLFLVFCFFQFGFAGSAMPPKEKKQKATLSKIASLKKVGTNIPPKITATGNQAYCPLSTVNIVTSVSITDPDDSGVEKRGHFSLKR